MYISIFFKNKLGPVDTFLGLQEFQKDFVPGGEWGNMRMKFKY